MEKIFKKLKNVLQKLKFWKEIKNSFETFKEFWENIYEILENNIKKSWKKI